MQIFVSLKLRFILLAKPNDECVTGNEKCRASPVFPVYRFNVQLKGNTTRTLKDNKYEDKNILNLSN